MLSKSAKFLCVCVAALVASTAGAATVGRFNPVRTFGDVPEDREGHTTVVKDNSLYVFGGYGPMEDDLVYHNPDLFKIDTTTGFSQRIDFSAAVDDSSSNGGGRGNGRGRGRGRDRGRGRGRRGLYSGPNAPQARAYHMSQVVGDSMYVGFGVVFDSPDNPVIDHMYDDLWRFDFGSNTWTPVQMSGDVPSPRSGAASAVIDGKIYMFGGIGPGYTTYNDTYVFDPATDKWTKLETSETPAARQNAVGVNVNGLFVVHGGSAIDSTGTGAGVFDDVVVYDPQTNVWYQVPAETSPIQPYRTNSMTVVDGKLVFHGGYVPGSRPINNANDVTSTFDLATGQWTQVPNNGPFLTRNTMSVVGDKVCAFGGQTSASAGANVDFTNDLYCAEIQDE